MGIWGYRAHLVKNRTETTMDHKIETRALYCLLDFSKARETGATT